MLAALILILAVTLYRVCYALAGSPGGWANFSPLAAILLCSAAYLPRPIHSSDRLGTAAGRRPYP